MITTSQYYPSSYIGYRCHSRLSNDLKKVTTQHHRWRRRAVMKKSPITYTPTHIQPLLLREIGSFLPTIFLHRLDGAFFFFACYFVCHLRLDSKQLHRPGDGRAMMLTSSEIKILHARAAFSRSLHVSGKQTGKSINLWPWLPSNVNPCSGKPPVVGSGSIWSAGRRFVTHEIYILLIIQSSSRRPGFPARGTRDPETRLWGGMAKR